MVNKGKPTGRLVKNLSGQKGDRNGTHKTNHLVKSPSDTTLYAPAVRKASKNKDTQFDNRVMPRLNTIAMQVNECNDGIN